MSSSAHIIFADFETSTFLSQDNVQYAHSLVSLQHRRSFTSALTPIAKVNNISGNSQFFVTFFTASVFGGCEGEFYFTLRAWFEHE